jgi:indole-3-glycerol phosphate synthase/phosphoribosylanthranilate isomerase
MSAVSQSQRDMAKVLATIVDDKYLWVADRKKQQPLESYKDDLSPSDRSFYDALSGSSTKFILECKKASPSKGLIRDDFNLDYIASVYADHATAISVLTDEKYFQGSFDFLPQVKAKTTQPILCKDFMVDSYQVYLARHYQADAILLMLSVVTDQEYRDIAEVAHSLNMGVLTEVSNEEELERAIALEAKVIGINNRNLRDLSIDLNRTKALAPSIPDDRIIISESGIYNNQQVRDLASVANGFLIGSSLMAEDDLDRAVRKVTQGEHKVCGLTSPEDASKAHTSGAVFGGLIFVEKSPRYVSFEQARIVMSGAPLNFVGVFQNHDASSVVQYATELGLHAVQLHGNESQQYITELRQALPEHCEIWKAYGISDVLPTLIPNDVDRHLLDAKVGEQSGGTGQQFDWSMLTNKSVMLAGGINPDNAKQAASLGCIGLDLNSGVESAPGKKDLQKLTAAFAAIKDF